MFVKSVEAVLTLFILIFVGWIFSKKGFLKDDVKTFLNKIIVVVCVPALTISNLFYSFSKEFLTTSIKYLTIIAAFFVALILIVRIVIVLFKVDKSRVGSFTSMSIVSNTMFFGLPINLSLYGEVSVQYVLCFYMINTIIFWSICAPMIKKESGNIEKDTLLNNIKNIFNVPFLTIIVCGFLIYNNITLPNIILKVSDQLSNMVTPLACIVIGKIIYDIDYKNFKIDKSTIIIIVIRLILSPVLMFTIARVFGLPIIVTKVLTIMSAMPIIMQSAIVTDLYGGDSEYVTSGIALTTLLTLLTTPIFVVIMDILL